jgi:hypothetical protein
LCIFCKQRRKMSREHVIPLWVSKVLSEDPRGWPTPIRGYRHDRDGNVTWTFTGSKAVELVMRRVCKVCNEGWMERELERPLQPILGPMLRGQATTILPEMQPVLAAWAAKVAMVYGYTERPIIESDPDWLALMYHQQRMPDTWNVWVSTYIGPRPVFHNYQTVSFPDDDPSSPKGVQMTLVIGYVALKVLGLYRGTAQDSGPEVMLRLWPSPDNPVPLDWPTGGYLNEESLPAFADMFVTQPGESPRPIPPLTSVFDSPPRRPIDPTT